VFTSYIPTPVAYIYRRW